ncbi:MAG: 5-formyltetrahydrofolate cyclo-ligase [Altibacter sp.]|uniref:5-formyltetrahydrofolate cyclo-ligase n=1 Tax=Altibacter sp. TaxID=2024823 RepID=UPI001D662FD1|nr:5-formyltetrahydrofolate cyclo-ligase [Altibacter sp.]MBZ0327694.1 5-formyltetrahydrofolate cyclo-ligase [Altibacter sp.]
MEKELLRKKYKAIRAQLSNDFVEEGSLQIANNTLELPIWNKTFYHLFLSIAEKKEVNTEYILHILQGKDKSIVVSKTDFKQDRLQHILLQENTFIQISKFGIPEPASGIEIKPVQLDVVFVPLLVFDQKGNRIGYGKGFYDRFLAQCTVETIFVGLSFFDPEVMIDVENTDIPLHYCVTPKKVYAF